MPTNTLTRPPSSPHATGNGRVGRLRASAWRAGLLAIGCTLALVLASGDALAAQLPVSLGKADSFAALAGSTVTSTGVTTLNGDLGVSPGSSLTGFPPGKVNGTIHATDPVAKQAQADLTAAYNDAAGRTPPIALPADVGGKTLTPGVYKTGATPALGLTGALTLDGQGDPNAVFVFQVGSALTTAVGSRVNLINGAQACNVFWQIGSSATLGTSSTFVGSILALSSVSMNDGVTVNGRALARNGAVTLINDTLTVAQCAPSQPPAVQLGSGNSPALSPAGDFSVPVDVNVTNGNAILSENDFPIANTSEQVFFSRHLNSSGASVGDLGRGVTQNNGYDQRLTLNGDGSVTYTDATAYQERFAPNGRGGYNAPPGYSDSLLARKSGFLLATSDRDVLVFDGNGNLITNQDASGKTLAYSYTSVNGETRLAGIQDPAGTWTWLSYDATGSIVQIDDPVGNHFYYGYDSQQRLTSYRNGTNKFGTTYAYNRAGRVGEIDSTDGHTLKLGYDRQGRVTSVEVIAAAGAEAASDKTTVYSYRPPAAPCNPTSDAGLTVVTSPDRTIQDYCYNADGNVTSTRPAIDPTVPSAIDMSGKACDVAPGEVDDPYAETRTQCTVDNAYPTDPPLSPSESTLAAAISNIPNDGPTAAIPTNDDTASCDGRPCTMANLDVISNPQTAPPAGFPPYRYLGIYHQALNGSDGGAFQALRTVWW